jgi:DNA-binding response OmpR family regulator
MPKILLVEDDELIAKNIIDALKRDHNNVELVTDGLDGLNRLLTSSYDLVIVDWNLPGAEGLEILREFRSRGGKTPVLFLTGRGAVKDKLSAFDSGADDYLTKPFHLMELQARVTALLRRPTNIIMRELKVRDLVVNTETRQVLKAGKEIQLLPKEFELLVFFMKSPDAVFPTNTILERVWSSESSATDHTFRQCLTRLRKKIETEGAEPIIKNVHSVGYKLVSS